MKKYWFLLESYVFVWSNEKEVLFYNALSGKHVLYPLTDSMIKDVILQLKDENNYYGVELTEKETELPELAALIHVLRELFMADLYDQALCSQKPLVITPVPTINEDLRHTLENSNNLELFGRKILKNLHTVSIQLTGKCDNQCRYCNTLYKQTLWCSRQAEELDYESLIRALEYIKDSHIPKVNFHGGNLLKYSHWESLFAYLKTCPFTKVLYFNILHFTRAACFEELCGDCSMEIRFCVNPEATEEDIKQTLLLKSGAIEYLFAVTSVEDFERVNWIIDEYGLNASIFPFYTGDNLSFFEQYVYLNLEDMDSFHRSKRDIFANQFINTNFFGHLFIGSDGNVRANVNGSPLGIMEEKLSSLVFKEMKEGSFWHLTRDKLPVCDKCLFRYICPSPSDYERVIGKANLCHLMKKQG